MDYRFIYQLIVSGDDEARFFNSALEAFDYAEEKGFEFFEVQVFKSYD